MNFWATYTLSEDLVLAINRQYFRLLFFKKENVFFMTATVVSAVLLLGTSVFYTNRFSLWLSAVGLCLYLFVLGCATIWIIWYFQLMKRSRAAWKLLEDPDVKLVLSDTHIEISGSTGTRRIAWEKITGIDETKDFLMLFSEKMPMFNFPKKCFPPEIIESMKNRINQNKGT